MARTCQVAKTKKVLKYPGRQHNRCLKCGRARGFLRRFKMCRICFRKYASLGQIPGVTKSSW